MRLTSTLNTKLAVGAAALAGLGFGTLGLGMAQAQAPTSSPAPVVQTGGPQGQSTAGGGAEDTQGSPVGAEAATPEADNDAAAQAAACQKAGIADPAANVQFDDQTGACTLDTGGSQTGGGLQQ